ncbi:hypothetical protein IT570_00535 [Candidatus Sumerlaeota bacterium]|nr:hypothetical protein [Candidatus Sumerlaeota bacterium]
MLKIGMIVYQKLLIAPRLYRVADADSRHAQLTPISLGATPEQSPVDDLRRYRIRTTDEVFFREASAQVIRILNPHSDEVFEYEVVVDGDVVIVSEYDLTVGEGALTPQPEGMLAQLDVAPWPLVSARMNLLDAFFNATERSMGISGYNGARMLPIPHQINAARYALQFGRVRFILADEVGLGKTIEAGLILSTLRKYFPKWRTAIFVPESLTAQWAFEMYGKFGKTIFALSEDEFDDDQAGIILPHDRMASFAKKEEAEILVVDEVHRLLQDPKAVASLATLSRNAHAVLLLTATPVADDWQNLLTLHRLIDPERFESLTTPEAFRALQEKQPTIEGILHAIRSTNPDPEKVSALYAGSGIKDKEIESHLKEAHHDARGRHELHRIATLLVDRYYPGARLLRYQRRFLAQDNALPMRIYGTLDYKPDAEELVILGLVDRWLSLLREQGLSHDPDAQRVATTLIQAAHSSHLAVTDWLLARTKKLEDRDGVTADPTRLNRQSMRDLPLLDGEKKLLTDFEAANVKWQRTTRAVDATGRALARSPRYLAFLRFLKETLEENPDSHLLVFTSFEANVHPLWLLLRKALTDLAEVYEMSGLQSRVEREKNAFEFQEFPSGSVLISDELGGEGRNFQFASHVIHFDLPIAPWTVEQRIGRCDRVGREEEDDVDSQVLLAKGQLDEAFFEFQAEALGVFNESIAPVEGELERIMEGAIATCIDEGAGAVIDLIDDVRQHIEAARERSNAVLLIRGAVGVEEARRVAEDLKDDEELLALRNAVITYARLFDSMVDEQDGGRVAITVGEYHSLHGLPGISQEMIGYFDRRNAVRHERLNFFSPGHPFVRSMALMAMTESPDRAAIVARKGIEEPAILFTYRISLSPEFIAKARDLPLDLRAPLLSKSSHLFASRMLRVAISLEGEIIPRIEGNEAYYDTLRADDQSIEDGTRISAVVPDDWIEQCLDLADLALEQARDVNDAQVAESIEEFEDLVCEAMTRVHPEHSLAEGEVTGIMELVRDLSIDLDSAVLFLPREKQKRH